MVSRQRPRGSRTAPTPPVLSGEQLSGTANENETMRSQDIAALRSSFDTQPYESSSAGEGEDAAPKATFVGEQIIYKDRDARVAAAAYLRAQARGFAPGYELDDWLAAEKEIDSLLSPDDNPDDNLDAR
jgi:Protein of unknown function (DUF2934)